MLSLILTSPSHRRYLMPLPMILTIIGGLFFLNVALFTKDPAHYEYARNIFLLWIAIGIWRKP